MRDCVRISPWQASAYIIMLILPTAVLFVPSITAQSAGADAWAALLVALAFGCMVAVVSSLLASRFPNETVIQYAPKIIGKVPGKLAGFIYAFYFYYVAYFVQRQFAELMSSVYMVNTPPWVLIGVLTATACYALYLGIEPLCRTNSLVTIFFMITIAVIFLFIANVLDMDHFLPALVTPPGQIVFGAYSPGSWLGESAVILMLTPFIAEKKKIMVITLWAVFLTFINMLAVTVGAIALFSSEVTARMVFPSFSLASNVRIETALAAVRIDALFMAVWVLGMAFKLITFFYAGTQAFAQLFGIPSYRTLIIPGGILITVLSLNSWDNIADLLEFSAQVFPPSIIFVNFVLTFILLCFSYRLSKNGGKV
ncbi:MAG: GerAB/ArcD/ProY family transporter [Bacillota bacterium]